MANKRLIEDGMLKVTAAPGVFIRANVLGDNEKGEDLGPKFVEYQFGAFLNAGETVRVTLHDPFFIMINNIVGGPYYDNSRYFAPIELESRIEWLGSADRKLKTAKQRHSLTAVAPYSDDASNSSGVEFIGVDNPGYWLHGGGADGKCFTGSIKQVIKQIGTEYGGLTDIWFRGETSDSEYNKWWQCRQNPMEFIISILDWASTIGEKKTRWLMYPDDNKLIIQEQATVESKHRATYEWRGYGDGSQSSGDILEWELAGDNVLQMLRFKMATNGISATSGAYYDRITAEDEVVIGDEETPNKYNPKTTAFEAFANPRDEPQPDGYFGVGWTTIQSIPEHSAGDLGLRYDKYMDGRARSTYLTLDNMLLRCRFRISGHYIWSGSEGLGADTINIVMMSAEGEKHYLHGNWIVYGFNHVVTRANWFTDLYCARLDYDATAQQVGK